MLRQAFQISKAISNMDGKTRSTWWASQRNWASLYRFASRPRALSLLADNDNWISCYILVTWKCLPRRFDPSWIVDFYCALSTNERDHVYEIPKNTNDRWVQVEYDPTKLWAEVGNHMYFVSFKWTSYPSLTVKMPYKATKLLRNVLLGVDFAADRPE